MLLRNSAVNHDFRRLVLVVEPLQQWVPQRTEVVVAGAETILVVGTFVTVAVVSQPHLGDFVSLKRKFLLARLLRRLSFLAHRSGLGNRLLVISGCVKLLTLVEVLNHGQIKLRVIYGTAATFCLFNDALGFSDDALSDLLLSYLLNVEGLQRLA